jgi:hypothetical protein
MATTATELLQSYEELPESEKKVAAAAISSRPLPRPPARYVGLLWVMVVGAFIAVLLGGGYLLYELVRDDTSTDVIAPLVTGAFGVLAGLLAPSPVANN